MRPLPVLLLVSLVPGGCASGPFDLVALTEPTTLRLESEPLGSVELRLRSDRRPPEQHGVQKVPGRSYVGGNDLREPTAVSLLRILARDLVVAGVAERASLRTLAEGYVLEVTIHHLGASYGGGVHTLVAPVFPTSRVEAFCAVTLVLKDRAGRVYLDRQFEERKHTTAALVSGMAATAAETLAGTLRGVCDEALPVLHRFVGAFWDRMGHPRDPRSGEDRPDGARGQAPRETDRRHGTPPGGLSPRAAPRSSTAR